MVKIIQFQCDNIYKLPYALQEMLFENTSGVLDAGFCPMEEPPWRGCDFPMGPPLPRKGERSFPLAFPS
jgi:hypothetical protein